MATEIIMPKLGLTMKTGTVVDWLKSEGEHVDENEPLLEIETEKLTYNIESPAKGVLLQILAASGEKYPIRAVLGYVGQTGESVPFHAGNAVDKDADLRTEDFSVSESQAAQSNSIPQAAGVRVFISPVAKKIASDAGIDYKQIKGTGPNGRIVKADVLHFIESGGSTPMQTAISTVSPVSAELPGYAVSDAAKSVIPYRGIRRSMGENMLNAWGTIPMVTHHVSADAGALMDYRAMLNSGVTDKNDRVTVGELILKLTAASLTMMPIMNSSLTNEGIVIFDEINLGMATAIDDGLIVPVIYRAERKGLLTISREAKDLAARAKSGALSLGEVQGATFTVSNLGGFGSVDHFTPIINPPQAAILGVGRVADSVVSINGEVTVRPMIGLSLTYDHRIIDGATAARFISILMKQMENPARSVLQA